MPEIPAQLLLNALSEQRNQALNVAAQQAARAAAAEARCAELELQLANRETRRAAAKTAAKVTSIKRAPRKATA